MLSKKHFIEFADFLVEEELKIIPRYNEMVKKLNITAKSEILEELNKQHRELTSEIMLILDKNSLRFNKYQFKNYIISHVEKKELDSLKNGNTRNLEQRKAGL